MAAVAFAAVAVVTARSHESTEMSPKSLIKKYTKLIIKKGINLQSLKKGERKRIVGGLNDR